jgi:Mg-chelatase subunit ChlD
MRTLLISASIAALIACGKKSGGSSGGGSGSGGSGTASAVGSGSSGSPTGTGTATGSAAGSGSTPTAAVADVEPTPDPADATLGANIALAALGGRVASPDDGPDPLWRASNLLDGFPLIRGIGAIETSLGWRSEAPELPQSIVIGFHDDREATIGAVVIDTASEGNLGGSAGVPKDVAVLVSTTSATDGFTEVAKATLPATPAETVIRFSETKAKWVRVAIASTHDGAPPQLGEIQIYEAAGATSIVTDLPKNVLAPALGGSLVWFTSQSGEAPAAELVDGKTSDEVGWSSAVGAVGDAAHLPQEFVFAFRDHRVANIDRVVVDPTSGMRFYSGPKPNFETWPATIEILISSTSPWDGFVVEKTIDVPKKAAPISVPIGKPVRFLKLRIVANHGGDRTTMGEVQAFEGAPAGGRTILAGRTIPLTRAGAASGPGGDEVASRREREPNNAQKEADRLDSPAPVGGAITPAGDRDVFLIPGQASGKQTATVTIEGRPAIRARVRVTDAGFATRYVLDPSQTTGTRRTFSLASDPGDLFVELVQPPAVQVVIWDTSGSMSQRIADLEAALRLYLGKVRAEDRVQLIRFDTTPEVLLKDFTGQSTQLVAALADKVFADGGTAIYDATLKGLELLGRAEGNRAIVLMTDGEDTSSTAEPSAFWHALAHGRTRLYAIGLGGGLRSYVARAGATAERVLANAAASTGGRYVFSAESQKLGALYDEIGGELRAHATYAIAGTTSTGSGKLVVTAVGDRLAVPPRVELVLDASGSMKRKIGDKMMMDVAKSVLDDVVGRLPDGAQVALRVYGAKISEKRPGACEDSQLVVPFGPLDRKRMKATIKAVKPLGTTPIAFSIQQAADDLRDAKGPAILIVVTDGREECGGDPAAAAKALRAAGLDVTLGIVGFGLTDQADRDAMTEVARIGGGAFFDARDDAALKTSLDRAIAVPYSVVDATGAVVGRGAIGGDPIAVPEGELAIRIESAGEPTVIEHVPITVGQTTRVAIKKDGDEVGVNITRSSP